MPFIHPAVRGPLFMTISTGSYVVSDTLMKLATQGLPLYEVLFLRGAAATLCGALLLLPLGHARHIPMVVQGGVLLRNCFEVSAVIAYVNALANIPIADTTALGQITPLLMLLGASMLFGERVGVSRMLFIGIGFGGALLVAQPTMKGISVHTLLAIATAVLCAARDLSGRRVREQVPGMIVAMSAVLAVLAGSGLAHVLMERWVTPEGRHLLLLGGAGFFLIFGHLFLFMAYRVSPTKAVAPYYYCFSVWAVISGLVVFGQFPNSLAICGILLITGSGLAIVMLDERQRRLAFAV